ncbi:MAG: hypothetical protein UD936_03900 [Acutalibacteraceae bacterium]|nr:hypothetical protein [Acutalibacteraceae bacterium]
MLKNIKKFFILDCIVFTILSFVLNMFFIITGNMQEMNRAGYVTTTLQYLSVTTVICILFFIFQKIISKDEMYSYITALLIVIASVFGLGGGVYKWFPILSWWSLVALAVIFIVYFSVYFLMFTKNIDATNQINKQLKEMQEAENE